MQPLEQGRRDSESGPKRQATETVTLRTRLCRVFAKLLFSRRFLSERILISKGREITKRRIGIAAGVAKAADKAVQRKQERKETSGPAQSGVQ